MSHNVAAREDYVPRGLGKRPSLESDPEIGYRSRSRVLEDDASRARRRDPISRDFTAAPDWPRSRS
jgi:hypothetical protein